METMQAAFYTGTPVSSIVLRVHEKHECTHNREAREQEKKERDEQQVRGEAGMITSKPGFSAKENEEVKKREKNVR